MAKKPAPKDKNSEKNPKKSGLKGILPLVSLAGLIASATIVFLGIHDTHMGTLHYTLQPLALPAFGAGIVFTVLLFFTSKPAPAPEASAEQAAPAIDFEPKITAIMARLEKLETSAFEMLGTEFGALKEANQHLNGIIEEQKKQEQVRIADEIEALKSENAKLKEMLNNYEAGPPLQVA